MKGDPKSDMLKKKHAMNTFFSTNETRCLIETVHIAVSGCFLGFFNEAFFRVQIKALLLKAEGIDEPICFELSCQFECRGLVNSN